MHFDVIWHRSAATLKSCALLLVSILQQLFAIPVPRRPKVT